MVRLSKVRLEQDVLEKLYDLFFATVGKSRDKQVFFKVLSDVLSPDERVMVSKRIAIYYMLLKGIDSLIICDSLKVTRATVAKYRFSLEKSTGIAPIIQKSLKNEELFLFVGSILNEIIQTSPYGNEWRKQSVRQYIKSKRESI